MRILATNFTTSSASDTTLVPDSTVSDSSSTPSAVLSTPPTQSTPSQFRLPRLFGLPDDPLAALQALLDGPVFARRESAILSVFNLCTAETLNRVILGLDCARLFDAVDDRLCGPNYKSRLLSLLTSDRLDDLNIAARAAIVTGLQDGATGHNEERAILEIFIGTQGTDLTLLKDLIDCGGDFHDFMKLIEIDIDDPKIQERMIQHIIVQGQRVRESKSGDAAPLKVLSDIDDTVIKSIYDSKLSADAVYPGVRAYAAALDVGAGSSPDRLDDKVFLSARPSDPIGFIENASHKTLQDVGFVDEQIVTGTLWSLRSKKAMGEQKIVTFGRYYKLFPEYDFVFTGDSGQGDAICAEAIRGLYPERVKATFIHDVWIKGVPKTSETERARLAALGVFVFDTYIGATTAALEQGLMTSQAASEIARTAWTDLSALPDEDFREPTGRAAYAELLRTDTLRLNMILPPDQQVVL